MRIFDSMAATVVTRWPAQLPDPAPVAPPGIDAKASSILGWLKWGGLSLAIAGIVLIGAKMTVQHRRGESGENLGALGWTSIGIILIGAAGSIVGFLM